jgi:cell division protein FtsB
MPRHTHLPKWALLLGSVLLAATLPLVCPAQEGTAGDDVATLKKALEKVDTELEALREENAALKQRVAALEAGQGAAAGKPSEETDELAKLRAAAQEEPSEAEETKETVFRARGIGLQALNPEISVTGDLLASWQSTEASDEDYDATIRELGIHFESYLDPYSRFKAAVPVSSDGAELEEAYLDFFGVLPSTTVTLGKFRQQFGIVNRWHGHALDQVDYPLALQQIFGPEGLNQTGVSVDWVMPPLLGGSQELVLQVTHPENERLFDGNVDGVPTALVHYKNYRDLSDATYLEVGLSALAGRNNRWEMTPPEGEEPIETDKNLWTWVLGADFSLVWEPPGQMRYRNIEWHTEFYWLDRDLLAPDGSGEDTINAWGGYTYLQAKMSRTVDVGLRLDYYEPDTKPYAESLSPLAVVEADASQWMVAPYLTWWQSPFVRFRVEYDHLEAKELGADEERIWLQCVFAAGPHKHERY